MNVLPNDVQLVVCKYLHYSLTIEVNKEYKSEYLNQGWWDENNNYFKFADGIPRMMFRRQIQSGKWEMEVSSTLFYCTTVYDKKKFMVAHLPKKY